MKKVNIICAGRLKEKYFADALTEYAKRLSRFCDFKVIETPDYPDAHDAPQREGKHMAQYLNKGFCVALDIEGRLLTSGELSDTLDKAYITAPEVNFFIGGSTGLYGTVKAAADLKLSFGRLTYPHQLMRVMLAEQVYRAFCIGAGVKYHK